jgi:tRNA A37 methylthiotransferase MiaB
LVEKRIALFKKKAQDCAVAYKKSFMGSETVVLCESKKEGYWQGYSSNYVPVKICSGETLRNEFLRVKITGLEGDFCIGEGIS